MQSSASSVGRIASQVDERDDGLREPKPRSASFRSISETATYSDETVEQHDPNLEDLGAPLTSDLKEGQD